jgi:hypothetical protein
MREVVWCQLAFRMRFRTIGRLHQGVSISVHDGAGSGAQVLRFDSYDDTAHYHYDPDGRNIRYWLDPALGLDALEWTLGMIAQSLPAMAAAGGASRQIELPSPAFMVDLADAAHELDRTQRQTLVHHPGDHLIASGPLIIGVKYDAQEQGISLRILRKTDDGLEELLGFDCYRTAPHYHYGPRHKNAVIPLDPVVVEDPLDWTLSQFRNGRLLDMLVRAGYPEVARSVQLNEFRSTFEETVEPLALSLAKWQEPVSRSVNDAP